ncbi:MAG TPA: DMT family transporter [Alphaproteobacteria bacterium]
MRFPNPHMYAWAAFFCFAILTSSVKALHNTVPVALILAVRSLIGMACLWPLLGQQGGFRQTLQATRYPGQQILRGALGIAALSLNFWALPQLPLADANGLGQIYPILLVILAPLILKEYAGLKQWAALLVGLSGALLIAQPHGQASALLPVLCVLASALLSAVGDLLVRYMGRHDHSMTITMWFFSLTALCTLVWWLLHDGLAPLNMRQMTLLAVIGIAGAVAQLAMVQAFKLLPAATMGVYSSMGLMWAVVFGWVFFSETPTLWLAGGAFLILTAAWLASYTPPKRAPVLQN